MNEEKSFLLLTLLTSGMANIIIHVMSVLKGLLIPVVMCVQWCTAEESLFSVCRVAQVGNAQTDASCVKLSNSFPTPRSVRLTAAMFLSIWIRSREDFRAISQSAAVFTVSRSSL